MRSFALSLSKHRQIRSDVSPWLWDCGLGLRGLALAKNVRPTSWQTTKSAINFHDSIDWSTVTGVNHTFLTYLQWAIVVAF